MGEKEERNKGVRYGRDERRDWKEKRLKKREREAEGSRVE
jgi:hypothetical protein